MAASVAHPSPPASQGGCHPLQLLSCNLGATNCLRGPTAAGAHLALGAALTFLLVWGRAVCGPNKRGELLGHAPST